MIFKSNFTPPVEVVAGNFEEKEGAKYEASKRKV
jgi:hypothetical protein